jgi:hypothetical protein
MMRPRGVEEVIFNRKVRKVGAKYTKLKHSLSILCADAEALAQALRTLRKSLRTLRLMVFDF